MTKHLIGIDLGTTNSAVGLWRDDKLEILKHDGLSTMPSVVAEDRAGNLLVGARALAVADPLHRYAFVKRYMGTKHEFQFSTGPRQAADISQLYLEELGRRAAAALNARLDELGVVVTVPAYFRGAARQDTVEAAKRAGLRLIDLVREPVAAAAAYADAHPLPTGKQHEALLVYDLGGGTFDVTLCVRTAKRIRVGANDRAYSGHRALGGVDLDSALVGELLRRCGYESLDSVFGGGGSTPDTDDARATELPAVTWELLRVAEDTKKKLSRDPEAYWELNLEVANRACRGSGYVTRQEFASLVDKTLDETFKYCDIVLRDHGRSIPGTEALDEQAVIRHTVRQLDRVVLVGGSTYIPSIADKIRNRYNPYRAGLEPLLVQHFRPDECVALGAALYAQSRPAIVDVPSIVWSPGYEAYARVPEGEEAHDEIQGRLEISSASGKTFELVSGSATRRTVVGDQGSFHFARFPLPPANTPVRLRLIDGDGRVAFEQTFEIRRQGIDLGVTGLPHDVRLDLAGDDVVLLRRGHTEGERSLPVQLYGRDSSPRVRLPLREDTSFFGVREIDLKLVPGAPVSIVSHYDDECVSLEVTCENKTHTVRYPFERQDAIRDRNALLKEYAELKADIERALARLRPEGVNVKDLEEELTRLGNAIQLAIGHMNIDRSRVHELLDELRALSRRAELSGTSKQALLERIDFVGKNADLGPQKEKLEALNKQVQSLPSNPDPAVLHRYDDDFGKLLLEIHQAQFSSDAQRKELTARVDSYLHLLEQHSADRPSIKETVSKLRKTFDATKDQADTGRVIQFLMQALTSLRQIAYGAIVKEQQRGLLSRIAPKLD